MNKNKFSSKSFNLTEAEIAAKKLLFNLGIDLSDHNYKDTARRMVEVLSEFTSWIRENKDKFLDEHFNKKFPKHNDRQNCYKGMVVQGPIRVYSLCSHHLLPVIYDVIFGYIPKRNKQIGFSKTIRIIRQIAKRPMNQEDFTQEIVDIFYNKLKPKGLGVIVSGIHFCMKMRGVCSDAVNKTSAVKGDFKNNQKTRNEFMKLAINFHSYL